VSHHLLIALGPTLLGVFALAYPVLKQRFAPHGIRQR